MTIKCTRGVFWTGIIAVSLLLSSWHPTVASAEPSQDPVMIRDQVITLIEDELSSAYSYTRKSLHRVPHFEVIDKIFPTWHHGEAATARQFWVKANYHTFLVYYRVDYVYLISDVAAKVEGKKFVFWSQEDDAPDYEGYWPFQLWAALGKRTHRDNTYLSAAYAMRYKMKLSLNETGEWVITEERYSDNPEMINNLRDHCSFEKLLPDWGLKNECNQKLLPQ